MVKYAYSRFVILVSQSGLAVRPWSTERRGISPPFLLPERGDSYMKENVLSIFIDESGDFGPYEHHTPYYLVAMVLHNQSVSIESNIQELTQHVHNLGYPDHAIHIGPLIRRESIYCNDRMDERKKLFNALFNFTRKLMSMTPQKHRSC